MKGPPLATTSPKEVPPPAAAGGEGTRLGNLLHGTSDLFLRDGEAHARTRRLKVAADPKHWFEFGAEAAAPLTALDAILMRKDPPFNMQYIYTTTLLERAEARGVLVVNKPQSLRDCNENSSPPGSQTSRRRRW